MSKKLSKLSHLYERNQNIEKDYNKLLEHFEKSEFIRKQQKNLIDSLKTELETLKKHQPEPHQHKKSKPKAKK
jgi:uncharacterized protein YlbG (UPF0298 family)